MLSNRIESTTDAPVKSQYPKGVLLLLIQRTIPTYGIATEVRTVNQISHLPTVG